MFTHYSFKTPLKLVEYPFFTMNTTA
jgi:hypothetical protein